MSDPSPRLLTLGTIAGMVLTIIGVAGVPGDLAVWRGWIRSVRAWVPWWALTVAGLLMLVVTWRTAISHSRIGILLRTRLFAWTPAARRESARRERIRLGITNLAMPAGEHARQLLRLFMHNMSDSSDPARQWLPGLLQGNTVD
jgi:hypothetical protein